MKKWIVLFLLVHFSQAFGGGWQPETKIGELIIEGGSAGERAYVKFVNDFNPDNCPSSSGFFKRISGDSPKGKYLIATIISAKSLDRNVAALLQGCDDWGRPILEGLWVK